jgi:hypothetical protein
VVVAVGAASYFAFRHFFRDQAAAPGPVLADAEAGSLPADANPGNRVAGKKSALELLANLADRRRLEEERQRQEEERLAQEQERQRQKNDERERQGMLMLQEQERILAAKKNPQLAATLEEIDKSPDKFYGKILTVDRVVVKGTAIDRHKDLGRYTLGATTERNNYYSRVPLSGLLLSTTDKLAADLQRKIGTVEPFPRVKLYCEVRKWERRVNEDLKTGPEVCRGLRRRRRAGGGDGRLGQHFLLQRTM